MAGNEDHPFASIVAAYRESQAPALDADATQTEPESIDPTPADTAVVEYAADQASAPTDVSSVTDAPHAAESAAPAESEGRADEAVLAEYFPAYFAAQDSTPTEAAADVVPTADDLTVADETVETTEASAEPATDPPVEESLTVEPEITDIAVAEPVVAEPVVAEPEIAGEAAEAEAAQGADTEKPSALDDPSKSILAMYYAQGAAEMAAAMEGPGPTPPAALDAEPEAAVEPAEVPAEAEAEVQPEPDTTAVDVPVTDDLVPVEPAPLDLPEPAATVDETAIAATEASTDPEAATEPDHTVWAGRHSAATSGAAASVLAAYYADVHGSADEAPIEPAGAAPEEIQEPAFEPLVVPTVDASAASVVDIPVHDADATAVILAASDSAFPASPFNPLGNRAVSGDWGAQALQAAGSATPIEPVFEAHLPPAVETTRTIPVVEAQPKRTAKEPTEQSDARRKFLMLAPIGVLAALAVLAVLLWNGNHSTPKAGPAPSSSPALVSSGTPLKRTQVAYASALTRFSSANDAGAAVVAGGAAHDTIKLLKDFKGATGPDKALLAAERAHLQSLSSLASSNPSDFAGATTQARKTLTAVQKAAAANTKAKAPNSSAGTAQAIELLGEGNLTKLQSTLGSLIARSDAATVTANLRSVASEAAGNADAANSLAGVLKNNTVQTTASALANKFSAMAPMARLNGDTLGDWSNIRPGMAAALGLDPVTHIDSLIANAKQKLATWAASQGNNANVTAIKNYASAMRSHFGAFGNALSQIPSLSAGQTGAAGVKAGAQGQAGNAYVAVNRAAFGGSPPASLVAAHNALVDAINTGTRAATAARNITVFCTTSSCTYGQQGDWGTYSGSIWIKGGWGGKVGAWESAVSAALQQASVSGPKPVV